MPTGNSSRDKVKEANGQQDVRNGLVKRKAEGVARPGRGRGGMGGEKDVRVFCSGGIENPPIDK